MEQITVKRWTLEEDQFVKDNYLEMSDKEIGERIGRTEKSVHSRRVSFKLYRPKKTGKNKEKRLKPTFQEFQKMLSDKNYSSPLTEYEYYCLKLSDKFTYVCEKHKDKGELQCTLSHFMNGRGCTYCGRERTSMSRVSKISPEEDQQLCESKNFEYISTEKINGKIYIRFICPKHRELGSQLMTRGNMKRDCVTKCQYCIGRNLPEWYIQKTLMEKYPNYELLSSSTKMNDRITFKCSKHNVIFDRKLTKAFHQNIMCPECQKEQISIQHRLSDEEIIKTVYEANPDLEIVTLSEYKGTLHKIPVRCKKCGHIWESPLTSIRVNKISCPVCAKGRKGEQKIAHYLRKLNIDFHEQYQLSECKRKRALPFDNSIFKDGKLIGLIEYQGEQHYTPIEFFGGEAAFKYRKENDKIKKEYCDKNNIPLLIIPYWEYNNIENLLKNFIIKIT